MYKSISRRLAVLFLLLFCLLSLTGCKSSKGCGCSSQADPFYQESTTGAYQKV